MGRLVEPGVVVNLLGRAAFRTKDGGWLVPITRLLAARLVGSEKRLGEIVVGAVGMRKLADLSMGAQDVQLLYNRRRRIGVFGILSPNHQGANIRNILKAIFTG